MKKLIHLAGVRRPFLVRPNELIKQVKTSARDSTSYTFTEHSLVDYLGLGAPNGTLDPQPISVPFATWLKSMPLLTGLALKIGRPNGS
jgi:hypothetical protein